MSNICYTILNRVIEGSLWRFSSQWSHGKLVVIPAVVCFELLGKILERVEVTDGVKAFIIFSMASFHFPVVPGSKVTDEFVAYPMFL